MEEEKMLELKNFLNRRLGRKGFTLAELLVVVAIIAILVAVSIPIFTSKLEASREATDIANMRAAKAAAVVQYLEKGEKVEGFYDAANGKIVNATSAVIGYGKGTAKDGNTTNSMGYVTTKSATDMIIKVTVTTDDAIAMEWVK
jgi:prepilin-type N-terminal cleavage/methylation domain-containing protein